MRQVPDVARAGDIVFADFWALRMLMQHNMSFQQLVQVNESIRKQYYMSWAGIYTGLEQYVDAGVLKAQLNIQERDYGVSS